MQYHSKKRKIVYFIIGIISFLSSYTFYETLNAYHRIQNKPLTHCGYQLSKNSVPITLIAGILAQEDNAFFQHNGVDWRQAWYSLKENFRHWRILSGASTIDMQVASLCYLEDDTSWRWFKKLRQTLYALIINDYYDKQAILRTYLTKAPLIDKNGSIGGFEKAAHYYYQKSLSKLNLNEQWGLILTLRNRAQLNPHAIKKAGKIPDNIKENMKRAKVRQQRLLKFFKRETHHIL